MKKTKKVQRNIGELACELLCEVVHVDPDGTTYARSYFDILNEIKKQKPYANTNIKSLYDYASYINKGKKGYEKYKRPKKQLSESYDANKHKTPSKNSIPSKKSNTVITEVEKIDKIIRDGCFIPKEKLLKIIERLRSKKNLILQGPPGTGKTWLSKRLAYVLCDSQEHVLAKQFHPNLSYEDFIRGWRPMGEGKLNLIDGPFLNMIEKAKSNPKSNFVMVIEEINRGNPVQIFGEMLTLLETDKRNENSALELTYRKKEGEKTYVPENLFVIGTMNIADRSLAIVDLALRRRFAFVDLEPVLGKVWRDWVNKRNGVDITLLSVIERKLKTLNKKIEEDNSLGDQFKVGHSFVTPGDKVIISDASNWFRSVVETEIGPLLDEYWFDAPETSREAKKQLLDGI